LSFRSEAGYDILTQNDDQFFGSKTQNKATNGYGQSDWLRTFNYNTNNFSPTTKVRRKISLDATLGTSFQKSTTDQSEVYGQEFPSDNLQTLASAGKITGGFSSQNGYTFLSYFARANMKFSDKYLLSGSLRYDASSRFGKDNRYGYFPAISAGWIISEEGFLKGQNTVSFLKLRASTGKVGNAEIGSNLFQGLYSVGKYNGNSNFYPSQLANPKLGWKPHNRSISVLITDSSTIALLVKWIIIPNTHRVFFITNLYLANLALATKLQTL